MTTGFVRHAQLRRLHSRSAIDQAVAAGRIIRVSRGWYAAPGADSDVTRALRAGGRLGCLSAARFHGLWVPRDHRLHVLRRREDTLPPGLTTTGLLVHAVRTWADDDPVAGVRDAVAQVIRHHDTETALIVLESALNRGLLQAADVPELVAGRLAWTRRRLLAASASAESGTETRVRRFFEARNVPVRPQVQLPGVGRVDLLVGESMVVECDSLAHHTASADYARDRRRDLVAVWYGYRVVRLTYEQVFLTWEDTQRVLAELVRAGEHRRRIRT